jgi:phosphoglycolate phosphatase-like HAD superfamily hydrolase
MIDLSAIRLFVFDFDGTLMRSNAIKRQVFYDVSAAIPGAAQVLTELFETSGHLDRYGIFQELEARIAGVDSNELSQEYTERCSAEIQKAPEVPGATALLTLLAERGRQVVIISGTPEGPLRELVPQLAFGNLINAIYGTPRSKHDNLAIAMDMAGCDSQSIIVIGDGESDRCLAANAGCAFIAVESDNNDFSITPSVVISRLDVVRSWF